MNSRRNPVIIIFMEEQEMTDSEKFTLIEKVKKDIQNMGFSIEIFHGRQIQLASDSFSVFWESNGLFEVIKNNKELNSMNQEQWEDYAAEIDNLNRAIFWVNTQIKSIVFE